jgi:glycosyltransferase involved in cell wall biosynthesis
MKDQGADRRRSVCIVSPGHLASNPRAIKEADALHDAGYRVTVVAGDLSSAFRPFDEEVVARAPWTAVRIGPSPLSSRLASRTALAIVQACRLAPSRMPLWLAVAAHSPQTAALARAACAVSADLYIAHYVAAFPAAAAAARRHGAALGYDAEDFHAGEQIDRPGESCRTDLVRAIEAAFLPRCSHLTASAPMIADAYAGLYGKRPVSVLNVFPLSGVGDRHLPAQVGELSAYWFSQTIGPDRGLQPIIQAMARTQARVTLHIRGNDPWGHGKALLSLAQSLQVGDRVKLLPMASPFAMVELAGEYDIGLAVETEGSENHRRCLANKIFTYLLAGRPVLMSDTPAQQALAGELGEAAAVVSLGDPSAIAQQLDMWALMPGRLQVAGQTACRLARSRFNWEIEKGVFLASVAKALDHHGYQPCPP